MSDTGGGLDVAGEEIPAPGRSIGKWVVQIAGFAIGIGLLSWCAAEALSEKNREQLKQLGEARWTDVALLVGLSLASLTVNGLAFWTMIRPVRRVPVRSVLLVNVVATALAYLPFKLSLIFRAAAHHRRDGVPMLMMGAWLANMGLVMLAVVGPALVASLWMGEVDARWWAASVGGTVAICVALVVVAGVLARGRWWGALERWAAGPDANVRGWRGISRRLGVVERTHEGVRMLAHPTAVFGGAALRSLDIGIQAVRFIVAARIVGVELGAGDAAAAASAYFLIGVLSPTGALGFREAGVFAMIRSDSFAVVVMCVSAVEVVVSLIAAVFAAWALRRREGGRSGSV